MAEYSNPGEGGKVGKEGGGIQGESGGFKNNANVTNGIQKSIYIAIFIKIG